MTECYVSAWETIVRDFGWVPETLGAFFGSSIVLFFGGVVVTLLIWRSQTKLNFELQHSSEYREVCRRFVQQSELALFTSSGKTPIRENPELLALMALEHEVRIFGEDAVSDAAARVVNAVQEAVSDYQKKQECSDGQLREALMKVIFERRAFVHAVAMRNK